MSVPSAPAFRSHPFLEQPLNIISLQIRKFVREPSTGSCVRIPPAAVCCVFFFSLNVSIAPGPLRSPSATSLPLL